MPTDIEAGMAYQQSLYLIRRLVASKGEDLLKSFVKDLPSAGTITSKLIVEPAGFDSFDGFISSAAKDWQKKVVF